MAKTKKKLYSARTDIERIESQWSKLSGLHSRKEWSAAVVRAATATEIAANLAIREEFRISTQFDAELIDSFLRWANGLAGKVDRLLLPLTKGQAHHSIIKKLKVSAQEINDVRNRIVHQGEFCDKERAKATIQAAKHFIEALVQISNPKFELEQF